MNRPYTAPNIVVYKQNKKELWKFQSSFILALSDVIRAHVFRREHREPLCCKLHGHALVERCTIFGVLFIPMNNKKPLDLNLITNIASLVASLLIIISELID